MRDQRLVAGVRAGNGAAFDDIYCRHANELLSFCFSRLGTREDADDAFQQTMMKAYRALRERESDEPVAIRPWLYTIARNECVSLLRRRQAPANETRPHDPDAHMALEDREEMRAVLGDISRLPAEQRQALLLSGVERLSGEEVADSLGTERDRVKSLVFRARRTLKQSREARELSCAEIREQLTVLRGGSLRRRVLREHLLGCPGCREFRDAARGGRETEIEDAPVFVRQ